MKPPPLGVGSSHTFVAIPLDGARRMIPSLVGPVEPVLAFPDGWIAVARQAPYRIDWISPEGEIHVTTIPYESLPLDRSQKAALHSNIPEDVVDDRLAPLEYPDVMPPYVPLSAGHLTAGMRGILTGTPGGKVLVRRAVSPESSGVRYDLVDRERGLLGYLMFDPGDIVVGAGERGIYVASFDEVRVHRLRRVPLPPEAR